MSYRSAAAFALLLLASSVQAETTQKPGVLVASDRVEFAYIQPSYAKAARYFAGDKIAAWNRADALKERQAEERQALEACKLRGKADGAITCAMLGIDAALEPDEVKIEAAGLQERRAETEAAALKKQAGLVQVVVSLGAGLKSQNLLKPAPREIRTLYFTVSDKFKLEALDRFDFAKAAEAPEGDMAVDDAGRLNAGGVQLIKP